MHYCSLMIVVVYSFIQKSCLFIQRGGIFFVGLRNTLIFAAVTNSYMLNVMKNGMKGKELRRALLCVLALVVFIMVLPTKIQNPVEGAGKEAIIRSRFGCLGATINILAWISLPSRERPSILLSEASWWLPLRMQEKEGTSS